ncbi:MULTISPECIES: energy transducer TonB [Sphingobacterium]|uniref:Energy transducer TonB n=1 Tax=Sphingobacterium populi TaxID=1812824 RepID=A0ABW5UCR1_9SPHI|nr:energy transducer TonB [Sphingobacterium sp. CFCC 11742]
MQLIKFIFSTTFILWLVLSAISSFARVSAVNQIEVDTIYTEVDVIPRFAGGAKAWSNFLNRNLNIRNIQQSIDEDTYISFGLVQQANLEFTVCEDGKVCDIEVLNADKISPEFEEEVMRVMKRSPRWKPALRDGQPVKTRFRQPVIVNLKER